MILFFFRQNECQTLPKFVACSIKTDAIKLMHYEGRALTYKSEVMFPREEMHHNMNAFKCFCSTFHPSAFHQFLGISEIIFMFSEQRVA